MSDIPSESGRPSADQTELEKLLRKSKPWFEENATTLIYALSAVLAIAAVWVYVNRTPPGNVAASKDLLLAVSPEDFGDVADSYPGTDIGVWARLRQADRLLDNAVTNMFKDRELGLDELDQAEAAYDRLATQTNLPGEIRERVLIGIARLTETRCNGNQETTDAAIAAWQRVLDQFGESLLKEHAEERIGKLATEESKSFYKWFAEQNPKPALTDTLPGQPSVPEVPKMPSITIPDFDGKAAPSDEDSKDDSSAESEKPAAGETDAKADEAKESSDEKTSDAEVSADKPDGAKVEESKPEESKPAEEKADDAKAPEAGDDDK